MSSPFPLRPSIDHTPRRRPVLDLASEEAASTLDVLGSGGARLILRALGEEPATMSDLAEELEMSLQNVQYHLERLCETGLVTEVDTWYSCKGREMSVYAQTTEQIKITFRSASDRLTFVELPDGETPTIESD